VHREAIALGQPRPGILGEFGFVDRLHKQALREEATRVPLLIQPPGGKLKPARVQQDVSPIDMLPMLLELCGLPAIAGLQERSLVPPTNDPAQPWEAPILTTDLKNHHVIHPGQWGYICYENGDEESYDRGAAPGRFTNLAGEPDLAGIKDPLGKLMPASIA
jgi:arylsulfatase A-like enzyme